ncbi:zinc finger protein 239-like [Lates japonicus]|uniref:Zinc finger protein 239-like protein n=1 Tax=Lates japonicus TaxID=270547 RepID=A0AAD3NIB2_LATJO|nr:zinc finger protein 239-like protein [Lates japonicus]
MKEENQDPDFIDQDHCRTGMKEENQDPDFSDRDHYNIVMKEENQDADFIDQDHFNIVIKEEDQDPDFMDQDQDHQSMESAGPTGLQDQPDSQRKTNLDQDWTHGGLPSVHTQREEPSASWEIPCQSRPTGGGGPQAQSDLNQT